MRSWTLSGGWGGEQPGECWCRQEAEGLGSAELKDGREAEQSRQKTGCGMELRRAGRGTWEQSQGQQGGEIQGFQQESRGLWATALLPASRHRDLSHNYDSDPTVKILVVLYFTNLFFLNLVARAMMHVTIAQYWFVCTCTTMGTWAPVAHSFMFKMALPLYTSKLKWWLSIGYHCAAIMKQ